MTPDAPRPTAKTTATATIRCLYCGGPQSGENPTCALCGATAQFVRCPKCNAGVAASEARCACGNELHPELPAASSPCPRCPDRALALRKLSDGRSFALQCGGCHGCFLRVRDWTFVVDDAVDEQPVEVDFVDAATERLDPAKLLPMASCPACLKPMDRARFGLRSPAIVDICQDHGIWFDAGELGPAIACAREIATTAHLPQETEAERRDMLVFEDNLRKEEAIVNAHTNTAQALFAAYDPEYRKISQWNSVMGQLTCLFRRR